MVKRLQGFLIGMWFGLAMPLAAAEVYSHCQPALAPTWGEECANGDALKSHFDSKGRGSSIRCKVS